MRWLWACTASLALWAAPPAPVPSAPGSQGAGPAAQAGQERPTQAAAGPELELPPLERLQNEALNYVAGQAAGLNGNYVFRVLRPPTLPRSATGGQLTFEPAYLSRKDLGGVFFVSFKMALDGRPLGLVRVDMEGKWNGTLLRAKNALPRKAVPDASAFEAFHFEGAPPSGALKEMPAGYRLRSPLAPGHVLVMQDLETIPVVMSGEDVRLEVVDGDLTIAIDALARTSGAVGEKVRLELPTSHKMVQAVVIGPGEARLQWAGGN